MSKNQNVTPADVAAKAAAEGVVIPSQPEEKAPAETTAEQDGAQVINENGEDSKDPRFKARLASLTNLVKENKRAIVALGAAAVVAGVAFAKYAKKKVEEEIVETLAEGLNEVVNDAEAENDSAA